MRKLWQRLKSAAAVLFGRENAPDPVRGGKRQGLTKAKNTAKSKNTFIADTAKFITKCKASDGTSTAHFVALNKDKKGKSSNSFFKGIANNLAKRNASGGTSTAPFVTLHKNKKGKSSKSFFKSIVNNLTRNNLSAEPSSSRFDMPNKEKAQSTGKEYVQQKAPQNKKAFKPLPKKKEKSTQKTVKQKISPQKKELSIPVKKAIETKIMYQQNAGQYEKSDIASGIKEVDFKATASAAQINDIISTEYRRFASDIYSQEVL